MTAAAGGAVTPVFTGLHAGARILVHGAGERWGAIGCALRGGGATYLVTAGHLFAPGGGAVRAATSDEDPAEIGTVVVNLLDVAPAPGAEAIDAALVRLSARGEAMLAATSNANAPRLTGLLDSGAIDGATAQTFRAIGGDYSEIATCSFDAGVVYLSAAARPARVRVAKAIRVGKALTASGDSGTILCTTDEGARLAIGTCVGLDGAGSLFAPLDRAVDAFAGAVGPLALLP